jgi:hypothetical protein
MDSQEMLKQRIRELEAALAVKNAPRAISFKVSEKGAVSAYGLGRFPVTLYGEQWTRLIAAVPQLTAFISAHKAELSVKADKPAVAEIVPAAK